MLNYKLFGIVSIWICLYTFDSCANALDAIGVKYKTDKSSTGHNYTSIYESYFDRFRDKPIKFLEIGFLYGSSARMWEEYFTRATLYFLDFDKNVFLQHGSGLKRSYFFVADQSQKEDLANFIEFAGSEFDIIIDDGGHTMAQQIISFEQLFPHVKSGGVYIIEDLHTSYWKEYGGAGSKENPQAGPQTAIYFLQQLIHDLNFIGARTCLADKAKCPSNIAHTLTYYQKNIKAMHFYDSLCFIFKN